MFIRTVAVVMLVSAGSSLHQSQRRGAVIAGTVTEAGTPIAGVEVTLDWYADQACRELAEKETPTDAEKAQLGTCRKEKAAVAKTTGTGDYEIADLPVGLYAITYAWTGRSRPRCGGFSAATGFLIASYQRADGTYGVVAIGQPFEVKAGARLEHDFECR